MKSKYICEAKMCKPEEVAAIPSTSTVIHVRITSK